MISVLGVKPSDGNRRRR